MSYASQHRQMAPVLAAARRLDIASNPAPEALFEAGAAGFQVWCTPNDHPQGWETARASMDQGCFSKPCAYLGAVIWHWQDEQIVALSISTDAYLLRGLTTHNRAQDLRWLKAKVRFLFKQAGVPLLPFVVSG